MKIRLWNSLTATIIVIIHGFFGSRHETLTIYNSIAGFENASYSSDELIALDPTTTNQTQLVYVHVGKTGGITLDMALRSNCMWRLNPKLRQNCIHALESQGNESQVSKKTLLTVHCLPRTGLDRTMKKVTGYLISVRNPITRAVSSFNMGHPDNKSSRLHKKKILPASVQEFYVDCFPTIEHIAKTLQKGVQDLTQTEQECYQIGVRVLSGFGVNETAGHLAMNYAHYNRMVVTKYPGRDMWILRTQYLWEDLSRVDKLLGGNGFFVHAGKAETHQSEMHTVSQGLSRNGTRTFCCFLASELQIYEDWLRRAVNLSPSEKDGTMVEIYNSCGVPTSDLNKNTSFRWIDWAKNDPMCSSYHR